MIVTTTSTPKTNLKWLSTRAIGWKIGEALSYHRIGEDDPSWDS